MPDLVVHAAGRVPEIADLDLEAAGVARGGKGGVAVNEYLQSVSNPAVYAAGDAAASGGLPLTPVARMQGRIVAANLLNGNMRTPDYLGIPTVAFTTPSLARVGLSDAIGTSAVQLARHFGAQVTGVCSSANLDLVRSLGADAVIDYTTDDFTTMGQRYGCIVVAVGNRVHPPSRADCATALAPGGAYAAVDEGRPKLGTEDLLLLRQLAETGELRPVIDRCYRLEQIAEAHRYVEAGHKKGNVIVAVRHQAPEPGPAIPGS